MRSGMCARPGSDPSARLDSSRHPTKRRGLEQRLPAFVEGDVGRVVRHVCLRPDALFDSCAG